MTRCDTYAELLGGYVLGALSPEETEDMRAHLATCRDCEAEHARLAGLPALLDRIEPADVPPPMPSPALEEAVLDRVARERRRARPVEDRRRRWLPRRTALRVAAGVAGVLVAAGAALAIFLPGGGDEPYASGILAGPGGAGGSFTVEQVPSGTRVYLHANRLDRAAYEVWCIRMDGRWVSGGTFRSSEAGEANATLTAAVDPGDYHKVVVTRDDGADRRGPVVMRGDLVY